MHQYHRSVDCNLRCYDIRIGKMRVDHIGQPVTSVRLSSDGQCVLVSSLDSTIRLMDKETGEMLNEYVIIFLLSLCIFVTLLLFDLNTSF